jgi:uncharacterized coiled-coil DUF342 family protein
MKLTANEAQIRLNIIGLIPEGKISQSVRVKLIRAQVELDKVSKKVQEDVQEGLKKIKPEGFDENYQKFSEAIEGKDTDTAREQAAQEGFDEFKAQYDKLNAEYQELYQNILSEVKVDVQLPKFNDADIENVAEALPTDGKQVVNQGKDADGTARTFDVPNTNVLRSFIEVFG